MITRRDLVRALDRRGLADWVVLERVQSIASIDERTKVRRVERRTMWQVTAHYDSPAGRGSAHVAIDAVDGNAAAAVDEVVALAQSSMGPAWISRPLSAPARVKLEDPALANHEPLDVAADVLAKLVRPTDVTAIARVMRERVQVTARQGFRTEWSATRISCDAQFRSGLVVSRHTRRRADLEIDSAIANAKRDLELGAGAAVPGLCALVLGPDALLHEGLGVWSTFATQADAVVERQGLTRYRERAPIAPGADKLAEPLTITSNGAADFGVLSSPLGDQGDAVRTFKLVDHGVAVGLGLTPREGALRGRDPNGGVRNLEVAAGTWSGTIDASAGRVIEVRRLRGLAIDPYTGDASLEIGLGLEHTKSGAKPFRGGSIQIDLIAALAMARRSVHTITRGAYTGPESVWIDSAELVA